MRSTLLACLAISLAGIANADAASVFCLSFITTTSVFNQTASKLLLDNKALINALFDFTDLMAFALPLIRSGFA